VGTLALIAVVSLATPFLDPVYFQRWFAWPTVMFSLAVPSLVVAAAIVLFDALKRRMDHRPFLAALAIFLLCYAGIGISFYPYILPPALTIEAAAAPEDSMIFLLVGAAVLIPLILGYTAYAYWVFRGKVDPEAGYH
jgi:cytochrome d ubiquinol oxidase subunit II